MWGERNKTISGNRPQCFSAWSWQVKLQNPELQFSRPGTPEVLQNLGSAQLKPRQLFPWAAEITLHFTSHLRSYQANYPGRKPRAVAKAKVLCKACPGYTGRQMLSWQTLFSATQGRESHTNTSFGLKGLKGLNIFPLPQVIIGSASS